MKEISTIEEFNAVSSNGVTLLDFYAPWCGPCRAIGPIIEELSTEFAGKAGIYKVNVDNSGALATKLGIRGVPTVLILKDGNIVDTTVGASSKATYIDKLNNLL